MATSTFLATPALLRPRAASPPAACGGCCCHRCSAPRGGLIPCPSARAPSRRRSPSCAHPVRLCVNVGSGWPMVLSGSNNRGFEKGLSTAVTDAEAAGQVGDDDKDMAHITNESLRATIRKSKEVLARHKIILEQISEKKKLISVLAESSIHNEQEMHSGQSDSSLSHLNAVSEGQEIDSGRQTYLATHAQQSEFDTTYGESIYDQSEYYESLEDEDTDFSGSIGEANYGNYYQYDSFPRASPSVYQQEVANGGLGDVAGALPKALARRGHRVMVVVPKYGDYDELQEIGEPRRYQVSGQDMEVKYYHAYIDGVDFVFIDNPIFHHVESEIYGGNRTDILKRMVLLCKAAVEGRGPIDDFNYLDLPGHYMDQFKLYDPFGGDHLNIFAAGIKAADRLLTVSHGYAWELKTPDGGWGLHSIISENDWKFQGIVNGVDTTDWNPRHDIYLQSDGYTNYSLETVQAGKAQCKEALQKELGLPVRGDVPVIAFIGRLDHQKGVDLIAEAMPWIAGQDVQLIMLGTGRQDLEDTLRRLESQHYDKVRGWVGFSVRLAHRMTAGADVLLMPSRFEPCGLNQLYAMMYGTVPVVHAVGGLRDTVQHYNPYEEAGVGWTFEKAEANRMIDALGHCLNTYRNYRSSWEGILRRGMMQDLSWDNAAKLYEEVLVAAKYQW
nr:unnamed protein product [Digitaria exilis]